MVLSTIARLAEGRVVRMAASWVLLSVLKTDVRLVVQSAVQTAAWSAAATADTKAELRVARTVVSWALWLLVRMALSLAVR